MAKKILDDPGEFVRKIKQLDRTKHDLQRPEENQDKRMLNNIMLKIIKKQREFLCKCVKKELEEKKKNRNK